MFPVFSRAVAARHRLTHFCDQITLLCGYSSLTYQVKLIQCIQGHCHKSRGQHKLSGVPSAFDKHTLNMRIFQGLRDDLPGAGQGPELWNVRGLDTQAHRANPLLHTWPQRKEASNDCFLGVGLLLRFVCVRDQSSGMPARAGSSVTVRGYAHVLSSSSRYRDHRGRCPHVDA